MNSSIKSDVGCFTAFFRGDKVLVGKKTYPAGYFFTNSLNEYWKEAPDGEQSDTKGAWLIGNRILSTHLVTWNVQEDIITGYLTEDIANELHKKIQYILNVIRRAKPFQFLDLKSERERCDLLFGEESVRRINKFLQERAKYALKEDKIFSRPDTTDFHKLEKEQAHLDEYISTLDYYHNLGDDMRAALDFGIDFVGQVAQLEKRDENYLIRCAVECIKKADSSQWIKSFQSTAAPNVEYIAIPIKPMSQNYIVGKCMAFTRFLDFLVVDFFEGIHVGHYPQICENCGRYYLKMNARKQKYCTQMDPNDRLRRTCQAVAAAKGREAKERHPLRNQFVNRLKTIRTHVKRGKLTEEQAAIVSRIARDRFERAMMDIDYANTKYIVEIGQDSVYEAAGIKF